MLKLPSKRQCAVLWLVWCVVCRAVLWRCLRGGAGMRTGGERVMAFDDIVVLFEG